MLTLPLLALVPLSKKNVIRFSLNGVDDDYYTIYRRCIDDSIMQRIVHCNVMSFKRYYDDEYSTNGSKSRIQKKNFVDSIMDISVYLYLEHDGPLPGAKIAQAGVESSWGRAKGVKHHNYFNIKSRCKKRGFCAHKHKCHELYDAVEQSTDSYRSFGSMLESFTYHNELLKKKRYKKALTLKNSYDQLAEIRKSGYATLDYNHYMRMHGNIANEFIFLDELAKDLKNKLYD